MEGKTCGGACGSLKSWLVLLAWVLGLLGTLAYFWVGADGTFLGMGASELWSGSVLLFVLALATMCHKASGMCMCGKK